MPMKLPPDDLTLRQYLKLIASWELPTSGEFSDYDGHEYSYGYCYGSSGERQYFQMVAQRALKLID